jgi:Na+/proline symporter
LQWTWAATLLQSSNVAWNYGVSGPFWYASGATIQVLLFGVLAIEVKRKARTAHTICEIVLARWGKAAHLTFLFFCFLTNVIVTSMLLLGGAATVNALTGMDINIASFLIPWGVIVYTFAGGLKATFLPLTSTPQSSSLFSSSASTQSTSRPPPQMSSTMGCRRFLG